MNGYLIPLTCPVCGGDVVPVADGRPNAAGTTTTAVCRCVECRRGWVVHVNLLAADIADTDHRGLTGVAPKVAKVFTTCKVCGEEMPKYRSGSRKVRVTCGKACADVSRSQARRERLAGGNDPQSTSLMVSA